MEKETLLDISVSPKSSKSKIIVEDSNIKIYLKSPPIDGKANAECIKLISKKLKISKSKIDIIKGEKSKRKRMKIRGISYKDALILLEGKK